MTKKEDRAGDLAYVDNMDTLPCGCSSTVFLCTYISLDSVSYVRRQVFIGEAFVLETLHQLEVLVLVVS
jgi:hypothetical protein